MNQPVQKNTLYVGKRSISPSSSPTSREIKLSMSLAGCARHLLDEIPQEEIHGGGHNRTTSILGRRPNRRAVTNPSLVLGAGGLAEEVDEKILHAVFVPFGEVKDVKTPLDQATQKHRSFGFVTFLEREDAAAAMDNMDGAELFGHVLTVNYAFPERIKGGEQGWASQPSESCPSSAILRLLCRLACLVASLR
jgi:RNA recognition motif-containing protein